MLVSDPVAPAGERVKVLDFGIAKLTDVIEKGGVKTDTRAVLGTPMYMSPEQCAGARTVDDKTDVYSLGCVLYQVLCGRPPFVAEGPGELIGMHLFQDPPHLATRAPKVPKEVVTLVHRLLVKDRAQRPNMSETADAIGLLLSKLSGTALAVRSCILLATEKESTATAAAAQQFTTIGQSIGQAAPHAVKRGWLLASGIGGVTLTCLLSVSYFQPVQPRPSDNMTVPHTSAAAQVVEHSSGRIVQWDGNSQAPSSATMNHDEKVVGASGGTQVPPAGEEPAKNLLRPDSSHHDAATPEHTADSSRKVKPTAKRVPSSERRLRTESTTPRPAVSSTKVSKGKGIAYED